MKALILRLSDTINNWKTISGIVLWFAYQTAVTEGWMQPDKVVLDGIYALIGVGVADKIKKITDALK